MADDRKDVASLGLHVDATSVDKASASLGGFQLSARGAAGASRDFGDASDRLVRQMDQMLRMQQETNRLLLQNISATRQASVEVESHTRRVTQLTLGVGAAAAAYELWGRKAQDTARTLTSSYQQMSTTIDQLLTKFKALESSQTDLARIATMLAAAGNPFAPSPAVIGGYLGPSAMGARGRIITSFSSSPFARALPRPSWAKELIQGPLSASAIPPAPIWPPRWCATFRG